MKGALDVARLLEALARLHDEGYEIVAISGGEPLVYRPLLELVAGVAALGFRVHMITNGILLSEERLAALAPHLFLTEVSLDGAEAVHNAVRGRSDAFRHALRALALLSNGDLPFEIINAATAPSLGDIPWAFELGRNLGARLLHPRPLAPEGRGAALASSWMLSNEDCTRLYLLAELLDADGRCYPFTYGIDPTLAIADITRGVSADTFRPNEDMMSTLSALLDAAFREAGRDGSTFIDWFAHLTRVSRTPYRTSAPAVVAS